MSQAGAWLQPHGRGLSISQSSLSKSTKVVNRQGRTRRQPAYHQTVQGMYVEYGLLPELTIGASANVTSAWQTLPATLTLPAQSGSATSITEPSLFLRTPLWQHGQWQLATQALWQAPRIAAVDDGLSTGNPDQEAELALLAGYSDTWRGMAWYLDMLAGLRWRDGAPDNQWRAQATLGITPWNHGPWNRWHGMLQAFGTYRTERGSGGTSFTQTSGDDYDQLRLQPSILWDITPSWSVQLGAFMDVDGRNTGLSHGVMVGLWRPF